MNINLILPQAKVMSRVTGNGSFRILSSGREFRRLNNWRYGTM